MSSRKRKHRPGKPPNEAEYAAPDPVLFIQAYEAEIRRGTQARQATESLEPTGSGLIEWKALGSSESIWVDRYDARLLLDALPPAAAPRPRSQSPSGWSDLPSDSEDTFFLTPEEADDYRRDKRRKVIDQAREERLRARREEDGVTEEDVWGGSDEEPDEAQRQLMQRTASSLASADKPAQLEMRILANYGADKRFAFLRGRWRRAWGAIKREAEANLAKEKERDGALGLGLGDYGSGDSDSEEAPDPALVARQARAKAWSESRKAVKKEDEQVP
ncbi:hypothetical protein MKEN_00502600 [Mycena kentingensis (nom. inval.)]|nr:hypothetical protein MKEN_00502600 [Mycena kentingensis (nom. inval.)]